jgi:hypothetical protein
LGLLGLFTAALLLLSGCTAPVRLGPVEGRAYEVSAAWVGGRPAVAWYGGRLAHETLFLQSTDEHGRPGTPLQLTDATRDAYEPSLQDVHGDALVAWYEQESGARGTPRRQWAMLARFDSSGRRRWQRQLSDEGASGRIPVVRIASGVIHAAWVEQRGDALPMLRAASFDESGKVLQPARGVAVVGLDTWNLNADVGAGGSFHLLVDSGIDSRAKELHWIRLRGDRIEEQRVSRDDGHDSAYPDIALEGSAFAVTWFDSRDGNEEVYLRCGQLSRSGEAPAGMLLDDDLAYRVTRTPAASTGAYLIWNEGHIELAWIEASSNRRVLWRQRFDRGCRPLGKAWSVRSKGTQAGIPALASSPSGLMLAWNSQRGDPAAPAPGESRRPSSMVLLQVQPNRKLSPNAAAR